MSIASDVQKRLAELAFRRTEFDKVWRQVENLVATDALASSSYGGMATTSNLSDYGYHQATAAARSKNVYDATANWAVDRLASGLEGLIMPQAELWHTLAPMDIAAMSTQLEDEDVEWLENLTRYMFTARYDANSGWQRAVQTALRRLVAFGNGIMLVEEGDSSSSLIKYRHLPLSECFLTEDHWGQVNGIVRPYRLTARQAAQKFGIDKIPEEIAADANDPVKSEKQHRFIQMISERGDFGSIYSGAGVTQARWSSVHVADDKGAVVAQSGYFEFPIIDFRWLPEPGRVYGEGPIMRVLADIQSLNLMAKNEMIASQQAVDPPLLVARNGVMNRPDTNAGRINYGGVDAQGREMIKPLLLGQRIDFAQAVIQAKRENLRESLYINLFALLVQNPRQSATEALIRANEKGELLGPAGSQIQDSLNRLIERELGILSRFGLYDRDSLFTPPRNLQGRDIGPKFQSPLDRLRRAKDAEGLIRTLEIVSPLMQINPEVADEFDTSEATRGVAEVLGTPRHWMRRREEVEQIRAARAQQQAQEQALMQAQQMATAAKDAAPALETLQNM